MALNTESDADDGSRRLITTLGLLLSIFFLVAGSLGAPLLTRIYFLHGGSRVLLMTFVQFVAFPLTLPFIYGRYVHRSLHGDSSLFLLSRKVSVASFGVGLVLAVDAYLYAYGLMTLPLSTSLLLISTQIVFTALFAYLLVRQKLTAFSINAIIVLVIGAVLLGVQSSSDRPRGVSNKDYYLGFFAMIGAAVFYGLLMPLIEWVFSRFKQKASFSAVLEMQIILSFTGVVLSAAAMAVNHDFQAISREGELYELGKVKYYLVLGASAVFWQMLNLGIVGVVTCSSALLSGVIIAMLLPVGEIISVILLREKFTTAKGLATALCLWGFIFYLYGEYLQTENRLAAPPDDGPGEMSTNTVDPAVGSRSNGGASCGEALVI